MSQDAPSDLELLARWRAGDNASGSALFRRHVAAITNFFRRNIYDRDEVEDLTQETFMALQSSTAEIENVSGYLYRIAFFKFTRHLRRRKNLPDHASDPGDDLEHVAGDLGPDPEYVLAQREDTRLLLRAIRRLALIHQQVLELSFWEELKGPAIAAILDIPIGTVASRLRLAHANLDKKLAELADSQEALRSTTMTVGEWRKRIKGDVDPNGSDGERE
jgi:RNA polymerase sigma factor (sigma-70 family)